MTRFEAADIGFHTYLLQIAGSRRSLKIVDAMRTLILIMPMRRVGHGLEELRRIHQDHVDIIAALEAGDPARAAAVASAHVRASQQARLEQFIQRERESSLPQDIGAFIQQIQADLG